MLPQRVVWYNRAVDEIGKEKIIASLRPAGFVLLVIIIGLIVYLAQRAPQEKREEVPAQQKPLTEEEILKSLTAPPDAKPQYTEQELEKILENLSAPKDSKSSFSEDEQKRILESLSAPTK